MDEVARTDGERRSSLREILRAADRFGASLVRLYDDLDVMRSYVGLPDYLVARLVVAELVGGVAVPARDGPAVGVFGPEGQPIQVFTTDTRDGFRRHWHVSQDRRPDDSFALVVFDRGVPAFVHVIPAERFSAIARAYPKPWEPDSVSLWLSLYTHCDFMLDPLKAEVLGVETFDLSTLR